MKLPNEERVRLFNQGRQIHWSLGNLFQNPMDITADDVRDEEEIARRVIDQLNQYRVDLVAIERKALKK